MNLVKERVIDGNDFEKLIASGVYNLKKHIDIVNDLNVFPVPDGDTGELYESINAISLVTLNKYGDSANYRRLVLRNSSNANSGDIADSIVLVDKVDSENKSYKIYGTHNLTFSLSGTTLTITKK